MIILALLAGTMAPFVHRSGAEPVSVKTKDVAVPREKRSESIKINKAYYDQLKRLCGARSSVNCCLSSVSAMRRGNYLMAPGPGCPEGTLENKLRCKDSLVWCEPIKEVEPEERIHLKSAQGPPNEAENKEGR